MSGYVPSNFDITNPTDAVIAETAQAEFRNMKSFFQGTLGRLLTPLTLVNSAAGTVVVSTRVPGSSLGTNRKIRTTVNGILNNSTGGAQGLGVTPQFGASIFFADTIPIGAGQICAFKLIIELMNIGTTNAQGMWTEYHLFGNGSSVGASLAEVAGFPTGGSNAGGTADTTVDQSFILNVNLSAASPSLAAFFYSVITEWL